MTGSDVCLNCGALLSGPYCASCGQKTPHTDLTETSGPPALGVTFKDALWRD